MIDNGSATANQLRTFLEENKVDLGELINNLVTTGEVTGRHLDGTEMILVVYPYVVAGGYTVVAKDSQTGPVRRPLRPDPASRTPTGLPQQGYEGTDSAHPQDRGNRPMNTGGALHRAAGPVQRPRCAEHPAPGGHGVPGPGRRHVRSRDAGSSRYTDRTPSGSVTYTGGAAAMFGQESWKWLLLQPLAGQQ